VEKVAFDIGVVVFSGISPRRLVHGGVEDVVGGRVTVDMVVDEDVDVINEVLAEVEVNVLDELEGLMLVAIDNEVDVLVELLVDVDVEVEVLVVVVWQPPHVLLHSP